MGVETRIRHLFGNLFYFAMYCYNHGFLYLKTDVVASALVFLLARWRRACTFRLATPSSLAAPFSLAAPSSLAAGDGGGSSEAGGWRRNFERPAAGWLKVCE